MNSSAAGILILAILGLFVLRRRWTDTRWTDEAMLDLKRTQNANQWKS